MSGLTRADPWVHLGGPLILKVPQIGIQLGNENAGSHPTGEFVGRYIFGHRLITMLVALPSRLDLASGFFEL